MSKSLYFAVTVCIYVYKYIFYLVLILIGNWCSVYVLSYINSYFYLVPTILGNSNLKLGSYIIINNNYDIFNLNIVCV